MARNRNRLIERALALGVDWVFFLDDDHIFDPGILKQLIAHDKGIISALYCRRLHPNLPLIFDRFDKTGAVVHRQLLPGEQGLIRVAATGCGGLLIRRPILEELMTVTDGKPFTLGQIEKDEWGDDLTFYKYVRDLGYEVYVDLDAPMGHVTESTVWPGRLPDGKWVTLMDHNGLVMALPTIELTPNDAVKDFTRVS